MGGTFDPIHYGHLFLAKEVQYRYQLDKIVFIPAKIPPHKRNRVVTEPALRYQMLKAATNSEPSFVLSDIEIKREGVSYSIDTVETLQEQNPDAQFFFITGADAILKIETWKDFEKLLAEVVFVAATRPNQSDSNLAAEIKRLDDTYNARIAIVDILGLEISSSEIRRRVNRGMPIAYLLPSKVEQMIRENKLYVSI